MSGWWEANRSRVYESRRKRYGTDAVAREAQQQRCRNRRQREKILREKDKAAGYELTLAAIGTYSGLMLATLRRWIKDGDIPEPYRHGGRMWFTAKQARAIREFGRSRYVDYDLARQLILMNWED